MTRVLAALYSALCYAFFFATFLYAIGFVEDVAPLKTIDSGASGGVLVSIAIDMVLLGIFALQHSVMARPRFKHAWTKIVPKTFERSTFVLFASLALALVIWQWRPLPQVVWSVADPLPRLALAAISWIGFGVVLASTFLINHFELFGLSQGFAGLIGKEPSKPHFVTPLFYRWLRHPIYAGFILAFWAAPTMTLGHLVFAIATTGYILVGIWFEERDLVSVFGERYRRYREDVGMLFPKLKTPRGRERATL
jgi:protein-S-isoprenylcysteine O-methyltransferase Ste14